MTQWKNKKTEAAERIRVHGIVAVIELSGRGYVYVRALSEDRPTILEEMDSDRKAEINAMPYADHIIPWQAEMKTLREAAIARARTEWEPAPRAKGTSRNRSGRSR